MQFTRIASSTTLSYVILLCEG